MSLCTYETLATPHDFTLYFSNGIVEFGVKAFRKNLTHIDVDSCGTKVFFIQRPIVTFAFIHIELWGKSVLQYSGYTYNLSLPVHMSR